MNTLEHGNERRGTFLAQFVLLPNENKVLQKSL